jgi:hypothetical protein
VPNAGRLFFPQSASLGLDRGEASCSVLAKITYAGVMAGSSFKQGGRSLQHLAELKVSAKQVERVVRRIGEERCDQRDAEVEAFLRLPLAEKSQAPPGVKPPKLAAAMADGGRLQILCRSLFAAADELNRATAARQGHSEQHDAAGAAAAFASADANEPPRSPATAEEEADPVVSEPGSKGKHWREDKIGLLLVLSSPQGKEDACPDIPEHFIEQARIEKLTRELHAAARKSVGHEAEAKADEPVKPAERPAADEAPAWEAPTVQSRKVVASRRPWKSFGPILAAAAWSLGFFAAERRAFVGDGSWHHWGVWRRHFSTFVPILDFIHALTYVYSAAMAGRSAAAGWGVYVRWIRLVWQGKVALVIEELRQRQAEVGLPQAQDKEGSPQVVVKEALTFLENHQEQMKYHEYRREGLPITSSHIESEIKRINQRVKGTEKFWSEEGAEAILQLRADYLSDGEPMDAFWQKRQAEESGQRPYRKRR